MRLDKFEALDLLRHADLHHLGKLAFSEKRKRFNDRITFVVNLHINPTNLCVYSCKFCDYAAKPGDEHAYMLSEMEILQQLDDPALRETHIVGGLWPKWGFRRSLALIRAIHELRPDIWIKAFTAVEVAYFARMEKVSTQEILTRISEAGVRQLPGGGAEILSPRIHAELFKDKIGPDEWLRIHEEAHTLGLKTNATMLFGHIETDEEIIDHLLLLRQLQDRTGGFQSFIPLAYQPGTTGLVSRMVSSPRCLKIIAISRLVLDNIPHIKAYWPSLHIETATAALTFGADDLDGTLGKERIMQLAKTASPASMSAVFLQKLIADAGQEAAERDGDFNVLNEKPVAAESETAV